MKRKTLAVLLLAFMAMVAVLSACSSAHYCPAYGSTNPQTEQIG